MTGLRSVFDIKLTSRFLARTVQRVCTGRWQRIGKVVQTFTYKSWAQNSGSGMTLKRPTCEREDSVSPHPNPHLPFSFLFLHLVSEVSGSAFRENEIGPDSG